MVTETWRKILDPFRERWSKRPKERSLILLKIYDHKDLDSDP
jgi:hypothetical protein